MTRQEAEALTSFKHHCMCGGYAWTMNGRDPRYPHMNWCPQLEEYAEWVEAGGLEFTRRKLDHATKHR